MANDFGTMRARILNETQRSDLATEVGEAILSAIDFYKGEPVVSNETTTGLIATVVGQRDYDLPSDFVAPYGMFMVADGVRTELKQKTRNEIMAMDVDADDPQEGTPLYYSIYGNVLSFWPRSDDTAKTYQLDYESSLEKPVEDDDDGFWMDEAERVVRCRAKGILFQDILLADDRAASQFRDAELEWKKIVKRLELREYARGIRPYGARV